MISLVQGLEEENGFGRVGCDGRFSLADCCPVLWWEKDNLWPEGDFWFWYFHLKNSEGGGRSDKNHHVHKSHCSSTGYKLQQDAGQDRHQGLDIYQVGCELGRSLLGVYYHIFPSFYTNIPV